MRFEDTPCLRCDQPMRICICGFKLTPAEIQALTPERGERRVVDKLKEARELVNCGCEEQRLDQAIRLIIDVLEERGK